MIESARQAGAKVVLLGMRYLKEPFGGPRLLACGLVLAGMLVMKL